MVQFLHRSHANSHQMRSGRDLLLSHRPEIFSTLVAKVTSHLNTSKTFSSLEIERVVSLVVEDRLSFQISITLKAGNPVAPPLPIISARSAEDITASKLTMDGRSRALAMAPAPGHLRSASSSSPLRAPCTRESDNSHLNASPCD
jgi:hypothetical protein